MISVIWLYLQLESWLSCDLIMSNGHPFIRHLWVIRIFRDFFTEQIKEIERDVGKQNLLLVRIFIQVTVSSEGSVNLHICFDEPSLVIYGISTKLFSCAYEIKPKMILQKMWIIKYTLLSKILKEIT